MPQFRYPFCMRFPSVLLLCGLIAVAPSLSAQQTTSTQAQSTTTKPAQTTPSQANSQSTSKSAAAPLRLESLPPEPHSLTPAQQKELQHKRMLAAINSLARNQANWGPAMSSPGASLALIDKGHKSSPEGTQVTFAINASGFQPGDSLKLLRWPLDSRVKQIATGLTVDSNGQVICPEISTGDCLSSMKPGDPVHIHEIAARGEPLRLAIVSSGGEKAESTIVPFPIMAVSKSCKMEVILGTRNAALVLLEGIGFPKNKKITIHIVTNGKDNPLTTTTNARGGIIAAVLPVTAGHTSGTATISYHGSTCSPSLSFPWGKGSYHPL